MGTDTGGSHTFTPSAKQTRETRRTVPQGTAFGFRMNQQQTKSWRRAQIKLTVISGLNSEAETTADVSA